MGWDGVCPCLQRCRDQGGITLCLLRACRIYVYTHRRMAITAEDVWLEKVIPIREGFAVEEGTNTLRWPPPKKGMKGVGAHTLLFYLLKFGIYSAFTFFLRFIIPGDTCASHGVAGRALID